LPRANSKRSSLLLLARYDSTADVRPEIEHGVVEAAKKAGIDPERALKAVGVDDPLGTLKTTN
jgi:hypothetical protein